MKSSKGLNQILSQISNSEKQSTLGKEKKIPPVENWNPEFCGDMDLVIKRDGSWVYMNSPMARQRLVKLFSTVIKKEGDNYFLVTPVEKLGIKVEDAPFLVVRMEAITTEQGPNIIFEDNCDNQIILNKRNPLWIEYDQTTEEPSPYINVRRNLKALIHRNVFYELINVAHERVIKEKTHLGVISDGEFFSLGEI